MSDRKFVHVDARISAAEDLLEALVRCEQVYGDIGNVPVISCDGLAAALLLIGGTLSDGSQGFPTVRIDRGGVEMIAEMSSSPIGGDR